MSSNKIKQDNIEQRCINRVKNNFSHDICFGVPVEKFDSLKEMVSAAYANPNSNDFPDFLFPGGFIEHFQVTSSTESRKGSSHKIKENKFNIENRKIEQSLSPDKHFVSNTMTYENHSYPNLRLSFEKNFEKHLESLKKYDGDKTTSIFMIEYLDEMALSMAERTLDGVDGIICGDINPKQEIINNYRLSRDKSMQNLICSLSDKIHYIIFVTSENIDIIDLSNIDHLQSIIPYDYAIAPNLTYVTSNWRSIQF